MNPHSGINPGFIPKCNQYESRMSDSYLDGWIHICFFGIRSAVKAYLFLRDSKYNRG